MLQTTEHKPGSRQLQKNRFLTLSLYLRHGVVNLLVLAVEDVLDELDVICPHGHLGGLEL